MTPLFNLWKIFSGNHRRGVPVLLGLMLTGTLLETLSIGMIIPVMTLITQGDLPERYPLLTSWAGKPAGATREWFVVVSIMLFAGIYLFKTLFLAFLAWQQAKFTFLIQNDLSERLFIGYLRQPYVFHLRRNSAQLMGNVVYETGILAYHGIGSGLTLLTELLALAGLATLLFIVEPLGAFLVVGVLGLAGWIFNHLTRDVTLSWGETRRLHDGLRLKHLQQGLGGVKDVKLLGCELAFLSRFRAHSTASAGVGKKQATLQALPRLWFELFAVVSLSTVLLVMIGQGKPIVAALPIVAVFAAAAFRLMPSVNRIIVAINNLRYALPVIDSVHNELSLLGLHGIEWVILGYFRARGACK